MVADASPPGGGDGPAGGPSLPPPHDAIRTNAPSPTSATLMRITNSLE